jgi:hypothetical protein
MKNYLFIFRTDYSVPPVGTPEQAAAMTKRWMDWIKGIAENGHLVDRGNRLNNTGKVVTSGGHITNGPFVEIKESIGGYTLIRATDYEEATKIAMGCPILTIGGHVEVRETDML